MSISGDDEDFDFMFQDDEPKFGEEFAVFERIGLPGGQLGGITGVDGKIDRTLQDPLERFQVFVDAISRDLMGQNISLDEDDIQKMIETARTLDKIKYKNPTAYVLGFIGSRGGSDISKASIEYAIKKALPLTSEGESSVQPEDVIRYSRLWLKLR
jgi:hypothetical protein|tara:strand:+ start:391 stop:858 length:468 start_codon:yes stop_codon:yes gene_type:complete